MAVNRAVSSHLDRVGPTRAGVNVENGRHEFRAHADSGDAVPVQ